jgi:hypothetical protein
MSSKADLIKIYRALDGVVSTETNQISEEDKHSELVILLERIKEHVNESEERTIKQVDANEDDDLVDK